MSTPADSNRSTADESSSPLLLLLLLGVGLALSLGLGRHLEPYLEAFATRAVAGPHQRRRFPVVAADSHPNVTIVG